MKNTFVSGQLKSSSVAKDELLLINQFKGIDLSNAVDKISSARGVYSLNYQWIDNRPQKRDGYSHIATVPSVSFAHCEFGNYSAQSAVEKGGAIEIIDNPKRINSLWHFVAEDGEEHFVAHVGYLLFEIKGMDSIPEFHLIYPNGVPLNAYGTLNPLLYMFEDYKSTKSAAVGKKCLWFLGGNKFVRVRFKTDGKGYIEPVSESEFSFIPTTMIGITYENSSATAGRNGLDYPNVMTKWRKNMLLSGTGKTEDEKTSYPGYRYVLDAPIVYESESDMAKIRITIKTGAEE